RVGEIRGDEREPRAERCVRDGLVHRPCGPPRAPPVEGVAKATRVPRGGSEMARDRGGLVGTEHLERDRRPAPGRDRHTYDPRLQTVVIGVVVLLSQQYVATRG